MNLVALISLLSSIAVCSLVYWRTEDENDTLRTVLIFLVFSGLNSLAQVADIYPDKYDYLVQFIGNLTIVGSMLQQIYFGYFAIHACLLFLAVFGIITVAVYAPLYVLFGTYTTMEIALNSMLAAMSLRLIVKLYMRVPDRWQDYRIYIVLAIFVYSSSAVVAYGLLQYIDLSTMMTVDKDAMTADIFDGITALGFVSYSFFISAFVAWFRHHERGIYGSQRFLIPPKVFIIMSSLGL